ncbi:MAG: PilC/PilY family type IV pilus protein [Pseudomonadota bacterium]
MNRFARILSTLLGCAALLAGAPAQADDSEVFTNTAFLATGVRPNVLFIVDTSGSMDTKVNVYDETADYTGAGICPKDRIYWQTADSSVPPDCKSNQWVSTDNNRCRAASKGMATGGWWRGRTQMLNKSTSPTYWSNAVGGQDWKLECQSDYDVHGDLKGTDTPGGENKRARNGTGTSDSNRWGNSGSSQVVDWSTKQRLSLYSSNYANWYYGLGSGVSKTRLDVVRDVAKTMIDNLDGVNLGLMRYSTTAEGGMVRYPVSELTASSRTAMKTELDTYLADGYTPLAETMFEANQYLSGKKVAYGNASRAGGILSPSVAESRVGGTLASDTYDSPMDFSCQNTYIVYLTDGLPTQDNSADTAIEALAGAKCPAAIDDPDPSFPTSGRCLETLTGYMHNTDLRSDVTGAQKVVTYFIGFGDDIAKSAAFLDKVATAGGGKAYTQTDAGGLAATLEEIFGLVQDEADTTFVAPTVSVNAFNRSQNLNELFVSVFAPSKLLHWNGNLKKYRIYKNDIYGPSGATSAVDGTGFFAKGSQAVNSDGVVDGPAASKGGAAHSLNDDPDKRNLYTYLGTSTNLTAADNAVTVANVVADKLTPTMVGAADKAEAQLVVDFARGRDLLDDDQDGDIKEANHRMGDPMHARPAIVIHGGTEAAPVGTVYVPTNDGFLHAFDMNPILGDPDGSGSVSVTPTKERWAFIPPEFLPRLGQLYDDPPTAVRDYALDGDVRVFKYDVNQNGTIETADGDKVYLFFGTGRGGSTIYSLDVTDADTPKFRWKKTFTDTGLGKLGKTWSAPVIARVNTGGTQNAQKLVVIFGGGYDVGQEAYNYSADSIGNAIFMLDLESGDLLWSATGTGGGGTLVNSKMTHSFPSNINVLDTNGDGFADRMYAADMGGQVWRFDIWNRPSVQPLVTGGVFASLGGANIAPSAVSRAENRRLYYAPDVAPITVRGSRPFMNIAIGSGYRGHPLNDETQDRFYAIRDYSPFTALTQASYNAATAIKDADLLDVTTNANAVVGDSALGWKIRLAENNGTVYRGEKVLSESVTANGVIFFTTFTPLAADAAQPCLARSLNRVYAIYATNARPFVRWSDTGTGALTTGDRYTDLSQKGIAPAVTILSNPTDPSGMGICQVGAQILKRCVKFGSAVRSFWEHQ